jgi:hypothetical protein
MQTGAPPHPAPHGPSPERIRGGRTQLKPAGNDDSGLAGPAIVSAVPPLVQHLVELPGWQLHKTQKPG